MLDIAAKSPKMTRGWEAECDRTKLIYERDIDSLNAKPLPSARDRAAAMYVGSAQHPHEDIEAIGSQGCGTATKQYGRSTVPMSVLEAIKQGQWDYEPGEVDQRQFDSTVALPGSDEKLAIMAERLSRGLPLWHPRDRRCWDDSDD